MVLNFIPRTAVANVLQKQHLASMVGFEKFYLKVGKVLHKKSAQVGLVKDGVVKASSSPSASSMRRRTLRKKLVDQVNKHV